ncbi:MAG: MurR/RpiR family transcriptional regulator [Rhodobacteraceae bacterium]|nr:MurR/RpiR family transcriptional regulator [Paracoccaceae bacterium]
MSPKPTVQTAAPAPRKLPAQSDPIVDVLGRIKDHLGTLSPAERKVGATVLADVPRAAEESIGEIARRAEVSEPTVTRFCRAIGCKGVRELKLKLAQSLVVGDIYLAAEGEPGPADAKLPKYWNPVLADAHSALREVERQISPEMIQAAAQSVANARQVVTFGLGGSAAILAEEARFRLFRYGVNVSCCPEAYFMRMKAATLAPNDVVLAISGSGKTVELIEAVGLARDYGATTIAVAPRASPLAEAVDYPLAISVAETRDTLTPTAVRYAYLAVIDLISAATGYSLGPSARESLRRIKYAALRHRAGDVLEPLGD